MKPVALIVAAVLVGFGLGAGAAVFSVGTSSATLLVPVDDLAPEVAPAGNPQPRCEVDDPTHNFGTMERNATESHKFMFKNAGDAPLQIVVGESTCKCTVGEVEQDEIPPGATVPVKLTWQAKTSSPSFRQSATIHTNDPLNRRLTLAVEGQIRQWLEVRPDALSFGTVQYGESAVATAEVYAFHEAGFQIASTAWLDLENADKFSVELVDIAADEFTDEAVKKAYRIVATSPADQPYGRFNGILQLVTNSSRVPELQVPLTGRVVSDISIRGKDYSIRRDAVELGICQRGEAQEAKLFLFVQGQHASTTAFELASATPDYLVVEFGERQLSNERAAKTPITIRIPAEAPQGEYLGNRLSGFAQVMLKTTHPIVPEFEIRLHYSIEE